MKLAGSELIPHTLFSGLFSSIRQGEGLSAYIYKDMQDKYIMEGPENWNPQQPDQPSISLGSFDESPTATAPLALPPPQPATIIKKRTYGKTIIGAVIAVAIAVVLLQLAISSHLLSLPGTYILTIPGQSHPTTNVSAPTYANYNFASLLPYSKDFMLLFNGSYSGTGIKAIYVKSYALPFAQNLTSPASNVSDSYILAIPSNFTGVSSPIAFSVFRANFTSPSVAKSFYDTAYSESKNLTSNLSISMSNSSVDGSSAFVVSKRAYSNLKFDNLEFLYNQTVVSIVAYGNYSDYNSSYSYAIAGEIHKLLS